MKGSYTRWSAGVVALGLVVVGCAPVSTAGTATAPSTTGLPPVGIIAFDPCELSDAVVAQLQQDPSTKYPYNENSPQGVESGCGWKNATINSTISLDLGRTTRTVQDYLGNTSFRGISPTTVGSHEAAQFTSTSNPSTAWSLAIGVPKGVVILTANTARPAVDTVAPDAKVEVRRMAMVLEPLLSR